MKTMLKVKLLRVFSLAMLLVVFPVESVIAHILTETSQFPDIKTSDARFDIVVLVGMGIVPETLVFEPEKKLSRVDLAAWRALVANLIAKSGDKPDVNAPAKAALEQGLVKSLDGDATYAEINKLFFQGKLETAQPDAVPTRAQAASYIAAGLVSPTGVSLLEKNGVQAGPIGEVSSVESRTNPDGGISHFITVGGVTMPMYTHGRVGNGPSDLAKWTGRTVRRSYVRKQGDISLWIYLESETVAGMVEEPGHDHASHSHEEATNTTAKPAEHKHAE